MLLRIIFSSIIAIQLMGCGSHQSSYETRLAKNTESIDNSSNNPNTFCSENGITAQPGETRIFYRIQQDDCSNSCSSTSSSVIKICQSNGTFLALGNPGFPISQYTYTSCRSIDTSACLAPPVPTQPPVSTPPTPSTAFEQQGCTPIVQNPEWYSWDGGHRTPWPSYNSVSRISRVRGLVSLRFTATQSTTQFGTITSSGYPGEGVSGKYIMSISKTPGCMDRTKLPPNCASLVASAWAGISWSNGPTLVGCKLTPGESYFVNIFFGTEEPHPSGAICPIDDEGGGSCGRDFVNSHQ